MRILLISPWEKRHRRYHSPLRSLIAYAPLTLPMVKALIPAELNATVQVFDEFKDKKLPYGPFDVVGISAMTSEAARAYQLADHYRSQGAFVVLGGYHVTFMPQEALCHADALVTGMGQRAWPQLLRDLAAGNPTHTLYDDDAFDDDEPGLIVIDTVPDRGIIPFPPYAPVDTVIATQGCPNHCSFCSISQMAAFRQRSIDRVIAELRGLKRRMVIFYDPNFFADRAYALDLMKQMEPLRLHWGATATVDFGFDDELLRAAKRAGCYGVLIGFESFDPQALRGANKRFCDPSRYRQAVENIHRQGMTINGTFVLGLDADTEEGLSALPNAVRELGIDLPIYFIATPTPGSALYERMQREGRILTRDWSRYTQADVVFRPQQLTPERLFALYQRAWCESYKLRNIIRRVFTAPGLSLTHKVAVLCMNIGFKFCGTDREHV